MIDFRSIRSTGNSTNWQFQRRKRWGKQFNISHILLMSTEDETINRQQISTTGSSMMTMMMAIWHTLFLLNLVHQLLLAKKKKKVSTKFHFVITICRLSLIRIKFDSHDIRFSKNSSPTLKQIRFTLRCFLYSFDRWRGEHQKKRTKYNRNKRWKIAISFLPLFITSHVF